MIQENKKLLLLRDLSARLPYGVRYRHFTWDDKYGEIYIAARIYSINTDGYVKNCYDDETVYIDNVRPYLFPLSSMTEEQLCEIKEITEFKYNHNTLELVKWTETHTTLEFWLEEAPQYSVIEVFDWLNKNHFDYRGLIEKGLAIDATGLNIY